MRIIEEFRWVLVSTIAILFTPTMVLAERPVTLHCEGVDYIYDSGIGKGPGRREASHRSVSLMFEEMIAEVSEGSGVRSTELSMKYGDYHGFLPAKKHEFGVNVLGQQVEINSALDLLEFRYVLEDGNKYLSFNGICERR